MVADWTTRDDVIGKTLEGFGRNSVPLYVLYDGKGEHSLLPQILGPSHVLDALDGLQE
jgi:thiol:disulfide interchange protein DsbD